MTRRNLPAVLGLLTGLFVLFWVGVEDHRQAYDARELRITSRLDTAARKLEDTINSRLHLIWGLDAFVKSNPEFTEKQFLEFARPLERHWQGIRSLQLAPNGVVAYMTQPELNNQALGLDLLRHPNGLDTVTRAIENREYIIAGPFRLVQGATAIVGRMPVYLPSPGNVEGEFWGFATILLDVDPLLESAGVLAPNEEFELALRGKDGLGEKGDVFFGEPSVFDGSALTARVVLPTGSWVLAARPKGGWLGYWEPRPELWLGGGALAIALGFIVYWLLQRPHQLKQAVRTATRALDKSRLEYRQLTQVAPSGIYHSDADGNLIFANQKFREIVGLGPDENSGSCWDSKIHPDDLTYSNIEWSEAVKSGVSYCEYRYLHDDGRVIWVLDRAIKTGVDGHGDATGFIGTLTDITELKEAQKSLEDAKHRADAANIAKSDFLASISHEIRTPLNGILGMVRVMLKSSRDKDMHSRLSLVEHSGEVLLELLNDALDLSQIESRQLKIVQKPFSINKLISDVAALWKPIAVEKGLRLIVDLDHGLQDSRLGDIKRIRQVTSNLLSNAIKFTDHGTVAVRVEECSEPNVRITVSDTGIGISPNDQQEIFDKFTQADTSASRSHEGSGLGLAICKQLVSLMNGRIELRSAPGEGSSFSVVLPCPLAGLQYQDVGETEIPGEMSGDTKRLRVLVAEDNPINQQVIAAILDQTEAKLEMVSNGLEAVERFRTGQYDLVLMDIRMPELDGVGATQRIRALGGEAAAVPIIAVTANALNEDRERYIDAGMNDCVTKPIVVSELLGMIARHTGKSADFHDESADRGNASPVSAQTL